MSKNFDSPLEVGFCGSTSERGENAWADEAMRLLDLYVRGFAPVDVARELVGKYLALPENNGRDIFDSNPAYTDAQLLAFQGERGEDKLPELTEIVGLYMSQGMSNKQAILKCREDQLLAALKENDLMKK